MFFVGWGLNVLSKYNILVGTKCRIALCMLSAPCWKTTCVEKHIDKKTHNHQYWLTLEERITQQVLMSKIN